MKCPERAPPPATKGWLCRLVSKVFVWWSYWVLLIKTCDSKAPDLILPASCLLSFRFEPRAIYPREGLYNPLRIGLSGTCRPKRQWLIAIAHVPDMLRLVLIHLGIGIGKAQLSAQQFNVVHCPSQKRP